MANFCENCGKPLNPGSKFCRECGAPVLPSAPSGNSGPGKENAVPTVTIPVNGPVLSVEITDEAPNAGAHRSSQSRGASPRSSRGRGAAAEPRRSSSSTRANASAEKAKNRMPGGRKFLALVLAAVDVALLVTIVKAANAEKAQDSYDRPFSDVSSYSTPAPYSAASSSGSSVIPDGGDSFASATAAPLSGADYSTQERPDAGDFGWYDEICDTGVLPDNTQFITDGDAVSGGWKGYIFYDFRDVDGSSAEEYLNVTINVTGSTGKLLMDWYQITWSGEEPADESQDADTLFTGTWADGELNVDGDIPIHLLYFFQTDGKQQYALGNMELSDGATGYIALVRP